MLGRPFIIAVMLALTFTVFSGCFGPGSPSGELPSDASDAVKRVQMPILNAKGVAVYSMSSSEDANVGIGLKANFTFPAAQVQQDRDAFCGIAAFAGHRPALPTHITATDYNPPAMYPTGETGAEADAAGQSVSVHATGTATSVMFSTVMIVKLEPGMPRYFVVGLSDDSHVPDEASMRIESDTGFTWRQVGSLEFSCHGHHQASQDTPEAGIAGVDFRPSSEYPMGVGAWTALGFNITGSGTNVGLNAEAIVDGESVMTLSEVGGACWQGRDVRQAAMRISTISHEQTARIRAYSLHGDLPIDLDWCGAVGGSDL